MSDYLDDEDDEEEEGLCNFTIVGNHFRQPEEKAAFAALEPGDEVKFVLEPDNAYDPNAIMVFGGEDFAFHLGYVPRTENEALLALFEEHGGVDALQAKMIYGNLGMIQVREEGEAT